MHLNSLPWRLPSPHVITVRVTPDHLNAFGHVNNLMYIGWLEQCAWAHSAAVGLPLDTCVALRRGMAVSRTEVDYLRSAYLGDELVVGNWVTQASRLRAERRFEIFRPADGSRLLQARVDYVCINLDSGAPCRFPAGFVLGYRVEPAVAERLAAGPAASPPALP